MDWIDSENGNIILKMEQNTSLLIADDGKGFNVNATGNNKTLGLLGMKERALMMGGEFDIQSRPVKAQSYG